MTRIVVTGAPGFIGSNIGNSIGCAIGNTIGNSIGSISNSLRYPNPPSSRKPDTWENTKHHIAADDAGLIHTELEIDDPVQVYIFSSTISVLYKPLKLYHIPRTPIKIPWHPSLTNLPY